MKINWFSPLPPAKTEIAHYTVRLLPELCRRFEVVLWTDQETWDPALESLADVRRFTTETTPWCNVNKGEINFYHIGNNPLFHAGIWRASQQAPGVVILHDTCLQHFFAGMFLHLDRNQERYISVMGREYGQKGHDVAQDLSAGLVTVDEIARDYPLTSLAVRNSLGTLAHVDDYVGEGAFCCHPLPYACNGVGKSASRPTSPPYRLIVFGYIGSNRRLLSVLEALSSFSKRELFRLDIFGGIYDEKYYQDKISELQIEGIATIHGFVPEEQLEEALRGADLAINLRYPTMGEASASQLRIWDHALPSVVTRVGWYASLPEDVVLFADPEHERRDLHRHLSSFHKDPARFVEMGKRGRKLLAKEHTPESYVEHLERFARNAAQMRKTQTAEMLVEKVSGELRLFARGGDSKTLVERTAGEIFSMLEPG